MPVVRKIIKVMHTIKGPVNFDNLIVTFES